MRILVAALVLAAVVSAHAHHPFTPYYDASNPVSVTGVVVELRAVNPHIVLIVDATLPDGRLGRWAIEGLPPNVLKRSVSDFTEKLRPGTPVTVSGYPAKDSAARAFSGREVTFADGSTLSFGSVPGGGGGDNWRCLSAPCTNLYRYPLP